MLKKYRTEFVVEQKDAVSSVPLSALPLSHPLVMKATETTGFVNEIQKQKSKLDKRIARLSQIGKQSYWNACLELTNIYYKLPEVLDSYCNLKWNMDSFSIFEILHLENFKGSSENIWYSIHEDIHSLKAIDAYLQADERSNWRFIYISNNPPGELSQFVNGYTLKSTDIITDYIEENSIIYISFSNNHIEIPECTVIKSKVINPCTKIVKPYSSNYIDDTDYYCIKYKNNCVRISNQSEIDFKMNDTVIKSANEWKSKNYGLVSKIMEKSLLFTNDNLKTNFVSKTSKTNFEYCQKQVVEKMF